MKTHTPSEFREAEVKLAAHMGRVAERADLIVTLTQLLEEYDRSTVLIALVGKGFRFEEGFDAKELSEIKDAMREAIARMEASNNEVLGLNALTRLF